MMLPVGTNTLALAKERTEIPDRAKQTDNRGIAVKGTVMQNKFQKARAYSKVGSIKRNQEQITPNNYHKDIQMHNLIFIYHQASQLHPKTK